MFTLVLSLHCGSVAMRTVFVYVLGVVLVNFNIIRSCLTTTDCCLSGDITCVSRILEKWSKTRRKSNFSLSNFSWKLGTVTTKLLGNYRLFTETQLWNHRKAMSGHVSFRKEENWLRMIQKLTDLSQQGITKMLRDWTICMQWFIYLCMRKLCACVVLKSLTAKQKQRQLVIWND